MKRSLEKSRTTVRPAPARDGRDVIPCDRTAVRMGNSYGSAPASWTTQTRNCSTCRKSFVVTAGEQQYWYETLGIPYYVTISDCLACRKRRRVHRRIITRLAELMPVAETADAEPRQVREAVLVIAEGTLRRISRWGGAEHWVLDGEGILLKGSAFINRLRKGRKAQDDLLPVLHHFQQRLGNQARMQRIAKEMAVIRQVRPALAKAMAAVEAWLAAPDRRGLELILDPPRL
jgi:hypothetical protein